MNSWVTITQNKVWNIFISHRNFPCALLQSASSHAYTPATIVLTSIYGLHLLVVKLHISGNIQSTLLCLPFFTRHNVFEINLCCVYQVFIPLCCCMDVPHCIYPLSCWWTLGMTVPSFGLLWVKFLWKFMYQSFC